MLSRRVDLPSGGYLMIDYAEALTVIDVNTGSYTGKGKAARLEDTITRTNLEAAEEVVNQLRLRDIGGIIVIDFIDMARARNRDAVLKMLRKALDEDRTKTFVVEISPLGLVEMTRQNVTDGAREIMTKTCPTCGGEGVVKSEETIAIEAERRLRELVAEAGADGARGLPRADEPEGHRLLHRRRRAHAARARGGDRAASSTSPAPRASRSTTSRSSRRARGPRSRSRACPFREGEEVHVDIVEPHMYSEDDAVAKVDGYLIEVADGDPVRRREDARADRAGGPHGGARGARRGRRGGRGGDRGARARRASARPSAPRRRRRRAAQAAERKPRDRPRRRGGRGAGRGRRRVHAGTGPAAVAEADEDARGQAAQARAAASPAARGRAPPAGGADGRGAGAAPAADRGRRRRRGTIEASAPRPQRRTAPFACEGRADAAEVSEASE